MYLDFFSTALLFIVAGGAILFAVGFVFGTIEVHNARLTCFHCGRETPVGRKHCESCGRDLQ